MMYKVVIRGYVQITHDHFMQHPLRNQFRPCSGVVLNPDLRCETRLQGEISNGTTRESVDVTEVQALAATGGGEEHCSFQQDHTGNGKKGLPAQCETVLGKS